jgi:hypothetical protein
MAQEGETMESYDEGFKHGQDWVLRGDRTSEIANLLALRNNRTDEDWPKWFVWTDAGESAAERIIAVLYPGAAAAFVDTEKFWIGEVQVVEASWLRDPDFVRGFCDGGSAACETGPAVGDRVCTQCDSRSMADDRYQIL